MLPNLGRGYSLSSGGLFGTCVDTEEAVETTYDYRLDGIYIHAQSTAASDIEALSNSVSYYWINEKVQAAYAVRSSNHFIVLQMVIDKYYTTMADDQGALGDNILFMIKNRDYLEFVVTCGPTYIRSQRKSSEFVVIMEHEWDDQDYSYFYNLINADLNGFTAGSNIDNGPDFSGASTFAAYSSFFIQCASFGLDIDDAGPFIVPTYDDLLPVLEDAFAAATANPDTGMIRSLEVVPWTSHLEFQYAADLQRRMFVNEDGGAMRVVPPMMKHFNFMSNTEHIQVVMGLMYGMIGAVNKLIECSTILWKQDLKTLQHSWVRNSNYKLHTDPAWAAAVPTIVAGNFTLGPTEGDVIQGARLKHLLDAEISGNADGDYLQQRVIRQTRGYIDNYITPCFTNFYMEDTKLFTHNWMDLSTCNNLLCQMPDTVWDSSTRNCTLDGMGDWTTLTGNYCPPEFVPSVHLEGLFSSTTDGVSFGSGDAAWTF
eukprot:CAMPEP_0113313466 /NCGR_PEP_ID=MMETSP0010_2-20120614/9879_1 /TAXON_ID=216773 ORGANISM="Corethron hystrix, Strain 308" /NCGR_SAMPLE_ID=MMETSP0010_2 /ASSEMBLY_ACC=CAM_ASM_000155 /LENGTH=483 /DNA_ID=CAMNT_0000169485 /DNA_START=399 /DNA_END=1850 /DNA_ORIENTATION=+ /assembly_acc=CAM_ASM_000155